MNPRRFFMVMLACLSISGLLIVGAVLGGNIVFKQQAKKLNDLKVQSKVIEDQQTSLIKAKKDIETYSELDTIAKSVVPQDKDQAKTVREITAIAAANHIELKAITFPASTLGQAVPKAAKPAEGEASSAPKTPTMPTTLTQAKVVDGIPGVYALEVTITSVEDRPILYGDFLAFLGDLESNRRTAHVEKININPTSDGRHLSFVLTLNAYVKP
jgi:hypothetical protein